MLTSEELLTIKGGAASASMLNSIARIIDTLYTIGQAVGSSIRRLLGKKVCKI